MTGARLFWGRPDLFFRSCEQCREFIIDEGTGKPKLAPDGEPIRRGPKQAVQCSMCPKDGWKGFSDENQAAFGVLRACVELGRLPRAGGVEDQEPTTLETLLLLKAVYEDCAASAARRREAEMMKALFGGRK